MQITFLYSLYDKSFKNPLFQKTYLKPPCSSNARIPKSYLLFYLIKIRCLLWKLSSTPFSALGVLNPLLVSRVKWLEMVNQNVPKVENKNAPFPL